MGDAEYMKYKDPKQPVNTRIKDLLGRMTLAEKIGQTTQIERTVASADVMRKYFIGEFCNNSSWIHVVKDVVQEHTLVCCPASGVVDWRLAT
jgi:beta-glucosidase